MKKTIFITLLILMASFSLALDTADIKGSLFPNNASHNVEYYGGVSGSGNNTDWALDFDGTDDYVKAQSSIIPLGDKTISMWIKPTEIALHEILVNGVGLSGNPQGFDLFLQADGTLRLVTGNTGGSYFYEITSSNTMSINTLYNINIVQNSTGLFLLVDDIVWGSDTSSSGTEITPVNDLHIGKRPTDSVYNFKGEINNIMVFNNALSRTELTSIYNVSKNTPINTSADFYLSGDQLTDLSSNLNNANGYGGIISGTSNDFQCDGVDDYLSTGISLDSGDYSFSVWANPTDRGNDNNIVMGTNDAGTSFANGFYFGDAGASDKWYYVTGDGSNQDVAITTTDVSYGVYSHVVFTRSGQNYKMYVNGNLISSTTATYTQNTVGDLLNICNQGDLTTNRDYDGSLSNILYFDKELNQTEVTEIYNNGRSYEYFPKVTPTPPTPTIEYPYEQINTVFSTTNITVLSDTYTTVLSGSAPSTEAIPLYITATFNSEKVFGNLASDLTCYMELNGVRISRDLWINDSVSNHHKANYLMSDRVNTTTTGTSTLDFLCRRTGNGQFNVNNIVVAGFRQLDSKDYNFSQFNLNLNFSVNSPTANTTVNSVLFDVPDWNLTNSNKSIYVLYDSEILLTTGTNNELSGYLTIDNLTCPTIKRQMVAGQTGSGNLICAKNVTGQNATNITSYAQGIFDVDTKINIKYLAFEDYEFKQSFLSDIALNNSNWTDISTNTIFIDDSDKDLFAMASISAESLTGDIHSEFRFKIMSENGSFILRDFETGNSPGLVTNQFVFKNLNSQNYTVTLQAKTIGTNPGDNGSIINAVVWNYAAGQSTATANTFAITAQDNIFSTSIQSFTATDGVSLSTTTGTINYPKQEELINITFISDNYFNTTVLNHNTSNNLQFSATPYAWVNLTAQSLVDSTNISNFTINCNSYGESTASGNSLLYQMQEAINNTVVNCVFSHPDYATTNFNVTVNASQITSYNIEVYTTNSVTFTFRDEDSNNLITANVTIQLIGDTQTYQNSTTTGSIYFDLISPDTYTVRYEAPGYDQNFFSFTMVNKSNSNITLYLSNSTGTTEVTALVIDENSRFVEGARIKTFVEDPNDPSQYILSQICDSNFEGQCVLNIFLGDRAYYFVIEYPTGETKKITNPTYIYDTSISFQIVIGDLAGDSFDKYADTYISLTHVDQSNSTPPYFTFTWNDGTNLANKGCIKLYEESIIDSIYLGEACQNGISGTINFTYTPNNGSTYKAQALLYYGTTSKVWDTQYKNYALQDNDPGNNGALLVVITLLFFGMLLATKPSLLMLFAPLPITLARWMGLIQLNTGVIIGLHLVFAMLAYLISDRG